MMAGHQVVVIDDFERRMIEFGRASADHEQRVVIGGKLAAVAAHERAERMLLGADEDLVGSNEPEPLLVPSLASAEVRDVDDTMPEPLYMRRLERQPLHMVAPGLRPRIVGQV